MFVETQHAASLLFYPVLTNIRYNTSTLNQAIALNPDHPKVHLASGYYQSMCLNDFNSALREFETAYQGEPNNGDIANSIGVTHWKLGNWKQAEKNLLKAVELDPLNFLVFEPLGLFYKQQRQFQKADYYFNLMIKLDPEQAYSYIFRAYNYLHGYGDIKKARSLLKEAVVNAKDPQEIFYAQYFTELYARDFPKALSYAISDKELYFGSLFVGRTYYYSGQEEQAQAEFESMRIYLEEKAQEEPASAGYHSKLGQVYAHLGLKEKAIAEGQKAVELQPVNNNHVDGPIFVQRLAEVYILTGEHELAINNIEYLLSIPSELTIWQLRLDPIYDPLRDNPLFQKLVDSVST